MAMEEKDYKDYKSVLDAGITQEEFDNMYKKFFHLEQYTMENYLSMVKSQYMRYRQIVYLYLLRGDREKFKYFVGKAIEMAKGVKPIL